MMVCTRQFAANVMACSLIMSPWLITSTWSSSPHSKAPTVLNRSRRTASEWTPDQFHQDDQSPIDLGPSDCRLQLECIAKSTDSHSERHIRIPVHSARGPRGQQGLSGIPGLRGPPGPRGEAGLIKEFDDVENFEQRIKSEQSNDQIIAYSSTNNTRNATNITTTIKSIHNNQTSINSLPEPAIASTSSTSARNASISYPTVDFNRRRWQTSRHKSYRPFSNKLGQTTRIKRWLTRPHTIDLSLPADDQILHHLSLPSGKFFSDRLVRLADDQLGQCRLNPAPCSPKLLGQADLSPLYGIVIDWHSMQGIRPDQLWTMFETALDNDSYLPRQRLMQVRQSRHRKPIGRKRDRSRGLVSINCLPFSIYILISLFNV